MRRAWNVHSAQDQIYEAGSESMARLNQLSEHLKDATADVTRTMTGAPAPLSRRKQLVGRRHRASHPPTRPSTSCVRTRPQRPVRLHNSSATSPCFFARSRCATS